METNKLDFDRGKAADARLYANFILTQLLRSNATHNPKVRSYLEAATHLLEEAFREDECLSNEELAKLDE